MMKIAFANQDETYIKTQVERGFYANATELVRDAVRRLREQTESKEQLIAALEVGAKASREEKSAPYTPELMAGLKAAALHKAASGEPVRNADVLP
jgi:antitoxin ParD1/3/4